MAQQDDNIVEFHVVANKPIDTLGLPAGLADLKHSADLKRLLKKCDELKTQTYNKYVSKYHDWLIWILVMHSINQLTPWDC